MMVADLVDRTKNVSGVLRALSLAREQGVLLRLIVIGDGEDREMLESLCRELCLSEQVTFLGRLPNAAVLEHMARTGTVVINSNVETFSVVTGEALTLGRPVVATRCGGPTAFVSDDNGMLVEPGDDAGLAEALGWFVLSYKRDLILSALDDVLQDENTPPPLIAVCRMTQNRLLHGPNNIMTP